MFGGDQDFCFIDSKKNPMNDSKLTGSWRGYYRKQYDSYKYDDEWGEMTVELAVREQKMTGEGEDQIGTFTIEGQYTPETGAVRFIKSYADHAFNYRGMYDPPRGIWGLWEPVSEDSDSGHFFRKIVTGYFYIWPKNEDNPVDISTIDFADEPPFQTVEARLMLNKM